MIKHDSEIPPPIRFYMGSNPIRVLFQCFFSFFFFFFFFFFRFFFFFFFFNPTDHELCIHNLIITLHTLHLPKCDMHRILRIRGGSLPI